MKKMEYICKIKKNSKYEIIKKYSFNIDNYFGLVNSLDRENKIKLMAKLSISIADEKVGKDDKKNVVDRFFGAFKSKKNTDEIISKIRECRVFNRVTETF